MRNWVFVKLETDVAGLYGWGECSLGGKTRSVAGALEDFAPMILGEDPTRIEHLYQKMYRQSFWRTGVIGLSAISGIEQACWDILGKSLGQPVYKLLGGAVRDRVRMATEWLKPEACTVLSAPAGSYSFTSDDNFFVPFCRVSRAGCAGELGRRAGYGRYRRPDRRSIKSRRRSA